MNNTNAAETDEHAAKPSEIVEARYSFRELLRKAENERRNSVLAQEMVDQSEIRSFFRNLVERK